MMNSFLGNTSYEDLSPKSGGSAGSDGVEFVDSKPKSDDIESTVKACNVKQEKIDGKMSRSKKTDIVSRLAWRSDQHKFKIIGSLDDSLIGIRSPGNLSKVNTPRSLDDSDIPSIKKKTGHCYFEEPEEVRCLSGGNISSVRLAKDTLKEDFKTKYAENPDIERLACTTSNYLNTCIVKQEKDDGAFCHEVSALKHCHSWERNNADLKQENKSIRTVIEFVDSKPKSDDIESTVEACNVKQEKIDGKMSRSKKDDIVSRLAWRSDQHKFKIIGSLDDSLIGIRSPGNLSKVTTPRSLDDSDIPSIKKKTSYCYFEESLPQGVLSGGNISSARVVKDTLKEDFKTKYDKNPDIERLACKTSNDFNTCIGSIKGNNIRPTTCHEGSAFKSLKRCRSWETNNTVDLRKENKSISTVDFKPKYDDLNGTVSASIVKQEKDDGSVCHEVSAFNPLKRCRSWETNNTVGLRKENKSISKVDFKPKYDDLNGTVSASNVKQEKDDGSVCHEVSAFKSLKRCRSWETNNTVDLRKDNKSISKVDFKPKYDDLKGTVSARNVKQEKDDGSVCHEVSAFNSLKCCRSWETNNTVDLRKENKSISKVDFKPKYDDLKGTVSASNVKQEKDDGAFCHEVSALKHCHSWERNNADLKQENKSIRTVKEFVDSKPKFDDIESTVEACNVKQEKIDGKMSKCKKTDLSRPAWRSDQHKFKIIGSLDDSLIGIRSPGNLSKVTTPRSLDDSDIPSIKENGYDGYFEVGDVKFLETIKGSRQNLISVEKKSELGSFSRGSTQIEVGASRNNVQSVTLNGVGDFNGDGSSMVKSEETLRQNVTVFKKPHESKLIKSISGQTVKIKRHEDIKISRTANLGNLKVLTSHDSNTGASQIVKLKITSESKISENSKSKSGELSSVARVKTIAASTEKPKSVKDLRNKISEQLKRKSSQDVQADNSLGKKIKSFGSLKTRSSEEFKSGTLTDLKTKNSERSKPKSRADKCSDSKPIIKKITHVKECKIEDKISDGKEVNSSVVDVKNQSSRSLKVKRTEDIKSENLKRKASESSAVRSSDDKKIKTSVSLRSDSLKTLPNFIVTASVEVKRNSSEKLNNGKADSKKLPIETTKIKEVGSKNHSEKKINESSIKDNGHIHTDKKDLRSKLINKAKETNTKSIFMQDFNAVLDCEETELTKQVKKRWGCDSIPSPDINLTSSNYWRKHQKRRGSEETAILEGYHRYSPLIERLMGTDCNAPVGKLGSKRKRQNSSDGYRWDGKRPKFEKQSNIGSKQVTASLHDQLKKAEENFRVQYQELRDHQDNQTNMFQWQYERRLADLQQQQTQEMQYLYSNSYDVQGLHTPFYSLRHKHKDQLYNVQLEHNRNLSRLEDRTKRRIGEERQSYSEIEGQLQQLVSQEERRVDKAGPKVPYKTVRLAKAPCRANKQTNGYVELFLPEDIGATMIQEDLIYDTFYKY